MFRATFHVTHVRGRPTNVPRDPTFYATFYATSHSTRRSSANATPNFTQHHASHNTIFNATRRSTRYPVSCDTTTLDATLYFHPGSVVIGTVCVTYLWWSIILVIQFRCVMWCFLSFVFERHCWMVQHLASCPSMFVCFFQDMSRYSFVSCDSRTHAPLYIVPFIHNTSTNLARHSIFYILSLMCQLQAHHSFVLQPLWYVSDGTLS